MAQRKVRYTARARTTGGRDGASRSQDGRLDIKLSSPGRAGGGTNPEQLLAAGWSASFISAMRAEAGAMRIVLPADLAIDAEVDLCTAGRAAFFRARFSVRMPGLEREVAEAVVDAARRTCPYSSATRGNVDLTVIVA